MHGVFGIGLLALCMGGLFRLNAQQPDLVVQGISFSPTSVL
jgi:hypothetical protein